MRRFVIKQGKHYCRGWWWKVFHPYWNHKKWNVMLILSDDCWWKPPRDNNDITDVNKLYGCGFGLDHHKNSWRIGWIPVFEKENFFNIYAYCYDGTGHISKLIGIVKANKPYTITVESIRDKYWFTCFDLGATIDMPNVNKDYKLQFALYPYFGGNNTAPKDETFFIDFNSL